MTDVPQAAVAYYHDMKCVICMDKLDTEPTEGLVCGHVFHSECMLKLCQFQSTSMQSVKCPICKCSSLDLTQANTITVMGDDDMDHDARGSEADSELTLVMGEGEMDHLSAAVVALDIPNHLLDQSGTETEPQESPAAVSFRPSVKARAKAKAKARAMSQSTVPSVPPAAAEGFEENQVPDLSQAVLSLPPAAAEGFEENQAFEAHLRLQAASAPPDMPQAALPNEPQAAVPMPQAASAPPDMHHAAVPTVPQAAVPAAEPTMPRARPQAKGKAFARSKAKAKAKARARWGANALRPRQEPQAAVSNVPQAASGPPPPQADGFVQVMMQNMAHAADNRQPAMLAVPQPLARRSPTSASASLPDGARRPLPPGGEVTDIGLFPEMSLRCKACGTTCMPHKMRCRGKSAESWECLNCGTKSSQLRRVFGKWPIGEFCEMEKDDQESFFNEITGMDIGTLRKFCERKFTKTESHGKFYEEKGQFLPLSVWATRGFNVEDIETKSPQDDKKLHPVLGMTYRVALMSSGSRGWKGATSEGNLAKRSKKAASAPAEPELELAASDASAVESETADSSSSSSSSSSSKKKSKKKKGKKSKSSKKKSKKKEAKKAAKAKAAAKAAAVAQKKMEKDQEQSKKLCDAVIAKCEGVSLTLEGTLKESGTAFLPEPVLQSCRKSLEAIAGLVKRAKLIKNQELPAAALGVSRAQAVLIISDHKLTKQKPKHQKRNIKNETSKQTPKHKKRNINTETETSKTRQKSEPCSRSALRWLALPRRVSSLQNS